MFRIAITLRKCKKEIDSIDLLALNFFSDAQQHATGNIYGVLVLNTIDGNKQSMLVLVPEPNNLLFLGTGIFGLGVGGIRRKRKC